MSLNVFLYISFCDFSSYSPQVPGDVLQGVPSNQAACQPLHQPLLNDAGIRDARAAVFRWHCLHQKDPGPWQVGAGGPWLLHETDERRSSRRVDYQNGLDLPHNPPARHELKWKLRKEMNKGLWQQQHTTNQKDSEKRTRYFLKHTKSGQHICQQVTLKHCMTAYHKIRVLRKALFWHNT